MSSRWITIIICFSFINFSFSAIAENEKIDIQEMKSSMRAQEKIILNLTKEFRDIDFNIGLQNKKYEKMSENRAKLQESLLRAKKNADLDGLNLKKSFNETKSLLMGTLINKLEKNESSSDLLARKILVENLQRKLADLDGLIKENKSLQDEVNQLIAKEEESTKTEKELLTLINELEQRKKEVRLTIDQEVEKKKINEEKLLEAKNKLTISRVADQKEKLKEKLKPVQITEEIKIPSQETVTKELPNGDFNAPILVHQGIEHQKKGVTFSFQGKTEVHAPKRGKVIYTGSLASYGNVVMIDHGQDTRTVLLGQFDVKVKNGDMVDPSSIVGYTNPKSTDGIGGGKVYFEVRKNNLAQNTYLLLDRKSLE